MIRHYLQVEVADTPHRHQAGLMFRNKLGEDEGMFFKFKHPQNLKFWGVNTYIPLSIAFVSSDNIIEKISYISPGNDVAVCSDIDCDKAIEANHNFFSKNNVKIGDKIEVIKDDFVTLIKFND